MKPVVLLLAACVGVGWLAGAPEPEASRALPAGLVAERRIREADLRFFEERVTRDPDGALDLVRLGVLLLARQRESGEDGDLLRAESAARRSLANRAERNPTAWRVLAAALQAQHRFAEAESAARRVIALEPGDGAAEAALGEILLELRRDAAADSIFRSLTPQRHAPAIAPRYARWLERRGRVGEARRLLEAARDYAKLRGAPLAQLAWYELRLGELALDAGARREARRRLEAGLALVPDDWRLLQARARLALETGNARLAVALGDSSLARHLAPATLAVLADAWSVLGDTTQARSYARAFATLSTAR